MVAKEAAGEEVVVAASGVPEHRRRVEKQLGLAEGCESGADGARPGDKGARAGDDQAVRLICERRGGQMILYPYGHIGQQLPGSISTKQR